MSVRRINLAGSWPDVASDVLTYAAGLSVVAVRVKPSAELESLWSQAGPEALMTLRHAVSPSGDVCAVGKSHEAGDIVVVQPGRWDAVAQAHGDNPCAVYWADGFIVVFIERAKPGAGPIVRALRVANGEEVWSRKLLPTPDGQFSSQGILDLGLDGSPIFTDARRVLSGVAGWTFTKPNVRDGIIVGQTDPPAIRIAVAEHVFTALAAPDGMAENPHLSVLPGGRLLVSAYTRLGASLAIIDPPYPPAESPVPNPGTTPPNPGVPPPAVPGVTITAYQTSVRINESARAVCALSGGPADRVIWLFRPDGVADWQIAAINEPVDSDHSYHFAAPGVWEIAVRVEGPGGSGQTGVRRAITVTAPTVEPPPAPSPDQTIPAPPALPGRTPCLLGVCWPIGLAQVGGLPFQHLRELALIGANAVRTDVHHDNPGVFEMLVSIAEAGLRPWPILRSTNLPAAVAFTRDLLRRVPWLTDLELENEPSARFSVDQYADLCIALGTVIRQENPAARIHIAAECFDFNTGTAHDFWPAVRAKVPADLYDGVAIHPYRNPHAWHVSPFGTREQELAAIREIVGDKAIAVTECGWGNAEPDAALNLANDLDVWRAQGATAYCVYAMVEDRRLPAGGFGLFTEDTAGVWTPSPSAFSLQHYTSEHPL